METLNSKRIFFALWPDDAVRGRLEELLSKLPEDAGRKQVPGDLHLTLEFIGKASVQHYDCLRMAATRIEFAPFAFELVRFGYFPKAKVVSAEPAACQPLTELARELRNTLRGCGHTPDKREYNPHVTLLRKSPPLPWLKPFDPVLWKVDRFCLVESRESDNSGRRYKVLEEFRAV
ncbi:MAG TPA: RNA 2',3'-cyclic phosphodiesterase [Gammaproteobacteria bacterium]|nr:RNA 2',3'-cyclic phosphodiesterase [Gammaproteobacteria bacterium]